MTLHQAADLGVAAVIFGVKAVGWCFGRLLDAIIGDALGGLVRAVCRRLKPPVLTGFEGLQKEADERGRALWAEVLAEARAHTPERHEPDPHVLKLSRVPTP